MDPIVFSYIVFSASDSTLNISGSDVFHIGFIDILDSASTLTFLGEVDSSHLSIQVLLIGCLETDSFTQKIPQKRTNTHNHQKLGPRILTYVSCKARLRETPPPKTASIRSSIFFG